MKRLHNMIACRVRRWLAFAMLAAGFLATPAHAAEPHASDWAGINSETQLRLISTAAGTGDLEELRLGLQFKMDPGWKVYWRSAGTTGYPPEVDWSQSSGIEDVEFLWPAPVRFKIFGIEAVGYKEEVVFPLNMRLAQVGETVSLRARVAYLTCKEICIPGDETLVLDIPAGPADATPFASLIDRYRARVPVSAEKIGMSIEQGVFMSVEDGVSLRVAIKSDRPLIEPDLFAEGPPLVFFEGPQVELSRDGRYAVITLLGIGATPDEIAASPMLG
ncbi:MAG: protein-disulfide reductase DsbD domain-containing protein, partial [Pseudomonadota bacterium]